MILHRDTPPALDPEGWLHLGDCRVHDGPPRTSIGATSIEILAAFESSCASIWGQHWRAPFEEICELRKDATKEWKRRDQIPPVMILGWIAWAASQSNKRAIGTLALGLTRDGHPDAILRAAELLEGLKGE